MTYEQQVEVRMQKAFKCRGILRLKDARLQQVDETKNMSIQKNVVARTHFGESELSTTLQQGTQHRQLPATVGQTRSNVGHSLDVSERAVS